MRLSKWIAAPAAGLVLLIGGIGVASAMSGDDRSASLTTTAATFTDDRTGASRGGADDPAGGDRSGMDSASDRNDDHGTQSGRDGAADRNDDRGATAGREATASLTGSQAERAGAAALAAVPGTTVREVEHQTGTTGAVYHVELLQRDGTRVEVDLNASFEPLRIERSGGN
jgi:uncharacterized membrane protein YkoI